MVPVVCQSLGIGCPIPEDAPVTSARGLERELDIFHLSRISTKPGCWSRGFRSRPSTPSIGRTHLPENRARNRCRSRCLVREKRLCLPVPAAAPQKCEVQISIPRRDWRAESRKARLNLGALRWLNGLNSTIAPLPLSNGVHFWLFRRALCPDWSLEKVTPIRSTHAVPFLTSTTGDVDGREKTHWSLVGTSIH
jgi:hypothetical protein